MSTRYLSDSEASYMPVYSCADCPEMRQTPKRTYCSRLNRDISGVEIPVWCPLGEIAEMVASKPKLEG